VGVRTKDINIPFVNAIEGDDLGALCEASRHERGLCERRWAVVHSGVGHWKAHEVADHGLELKCDLQRPLCDLWLVWSI